MDSFEYKGQVPGISLESPRFGTQLLRLLGGDLAFAKGDE